MNIAEKTVLITGANRGVGEALVKEALNRGAKRVFAGTRGALPNTDPRVTALTLDVTNASQIQRAVDEVAALDVLINNAGIAIYDDLTDLDVIQKQLDVNLLGPLKVTQAFLPLLTRSKGAVVNILSMTSVAPVPVLPSYSISKAAALSLTQSLRALLARQGVGVHGVILGSIDTDMSRDFDVPKVSPESAALGIFDGLENGEEDIFPDPTSRSIADGWRAGVVKALERRINAAVLEGAQIDLQEKYLVFEETMQMALADNTRKSSITSARVSNTRSYPGGLVSFLVTSAETLDHFSLFEARMEPGNEPPLHLHEERDVVFYVLEGEMEVYCGSEVRAARTGDAVFLPRLLPHTYKVQSPTVRFLALMAPAKKIEGYFEGLSQPVSSMDLPAGATASPPPDLASLLALAAQYGVKFLTPKETANDECPGPRRQERE